MPDMKVRTDMKVRKRSSWVRNLSIYCILLCCFPAKPASHPAKLSPQILHSQRAEPADRFAVGASDYASSDDESSSLHPARLCLLLRGGGGVLGGREIKVKAVKKKHVAQMAKPKDEAGKQADGLTRSQRRKEKTAVKASRVASGNGGKQASIVRA